MSEPQPANVKGMDVPIVKLTPLRRRKVSQRNYNRLVANLKAVGLIEPLLVCQEGDQFYILDGYVRYTALVDLGIEAVPCLVLDSRDLYTPNRQVNHLSPKQEVRMLRKALEKLDEKTIASAFGMDSLKTRLNTSLFRDLHPQVLAAMEKGKLSQTVAKELTFVVPNRQLEIWRLMQESGDTSLAFAKAQLLATQPNARSKKHRKNNPWERGQQTKRDLVKKLTEVEKHFDFYSGLYRQYVGDLLKLSIYVRQIITRSALREYLRREHPDALKFFDSLLDQAEGKEAV
jgi:ParB-like chromosome segregation protein Spo0J